MLVLGPIGVSALCPAWVRTNILDDERHRPASLQVEPRDRLPAAVHAELSAAVAATGLDPDAVAAETIAAIRDGRFSILPEPAWLPAIEERAHRIITGAAPAAPQPAS